MQKIIPHLWFDTKANEATAFYTSLFPNSEISQTTTLHDTPSGDTDIVSFTLWGSQFMAMNAGPLFTFNPSISFMVNFDPSKDTEAETRIEEVWKKLSQGGKVLMPIGEYPFSKRYGWIEDMYGLSWQLILTDPAGDERPTIIPSIMFVGDNYGKAKEATDNYISVFNNSPEAHSGQSKRGQISYYPAGMEPDKEGAVMFTDFSLDNQWFAAMESARRHEFAFNEAVSLIVQCENQAELDYFWDKLSSDPEAEQCGWLKDKYGVSWQVVPKKMNEMLGKGTTQQIDRLTQALLPMKKLDIEALNNAYNLVE